jgi:hypothetical protein
VRQWNQSDLWARSNDCSTCRTHVPHVQDRTVDVEDDQ